MIGDKMNYDVKEVWDFNKEGKPMPEAVLVEIEKTPIRIIGVKPVLITKNKLNFLNGINELICVRNPNREIQKEIAKQIISLRNLGIAGFKTDFFVNELNLVERMRHRLLRIVKKFELTEQFGSKQTKFLKPVILHSINRVMEKQKLKILHLKTIERMVRNSKTEIGKSYYSNAKGLENSVNPLDFQIAFNRTFSNPKMKNDRTLIFFPSWL